MADNPLLPQLCRVIGVERETPDILTLRVSTRGEKRPFDALPGQTAMLSLPGVGEGMFSVSAMGGDFVEFSVKRVGLLTEALHELLPGREIGLRGPYGNRFPLDGARGQNLLFVGGGIGLAPLRYCIDYALARREDFGHIIIVAGARDGSQLPFVRHLRERWPSPPDTEVFITLDEEGQGPVTAFLERHPVSGENALALLCGPTAMLKAALPILARQGFAPERICFSLERRMQCGLGVCGRCRIGAVHVCLDGPVFSAALFVNKADDFTAYLLRNL